MGVAGFVFDECVDHVLEFVFADDSCWLADVAAHGFIFFRFVRLHGETTESSRQIHLTHLCSFCGRARESHGESGRIRRQEDFYRNLMVRKKKNNHPRKGGCLRFESLPQEAKAIGRLPASGDASGVLGTLLG